MFIVQDYAEKNGTVTVDVVDCSTPLAIRFPVSLLWRDDFREVVRRSNARRSAELLRFGAAVVEMATHVHSAVHFAALTKCPHRLARFTMAAGALRTLAEKAPKVGLIEIPVE